MSGAEFRFINTELRLIGTEWSCHGDIGPGGRLTGTYVSREGDMSW